MLRLYCSVVDWSKGRVSGVCLHSGRPACWLVRVGRAVQGTQEDAETDVDWIGRCAR